MTTLDQLDLGCAQFRREERGNVVLFLFPVVPQRSCCFASGRLWVVSRSFCAVAFQKGSDLYEERSRDLVVSDYGFNQSSV